VGSKVKADEKKNNIKNDGFGGGDDDEDEDWGMDDDDWGDLEDNDDKNKPSLLGLRNNGLK
jgi:hypothetical protein